MSPVTPQGSKPFEFLSPPLPVQAGNGWVEGFLPDGTRLLIDMRAELAAEVQRYQDALLQDRITRRKPADWDLFGLDWFAPKPTWKNRAAWVVWKVLDGIDWLCRPLRRLHDQRTEAMLGQIFSGGDPDTSEPPTNPKWRALYRLAAPLLASKSPSTGLQRR